MPFLVIAAPAAACSSGRSEDAQTDSTSSATSSATDAATFGTLDTPCGPAEGANAAAGDQGVTADSVTIGYGDDAGYPSAPGFNHEMSDAVKALISWCNDQGGVNGRTVVGEYYDAKITEANNV